MALGRVVLHTWASVLETMCAFMMVVAIGSFAFSSIVLHAQGDLLVVAIAPSAPILVLVEQGGFGFAFSGAFKSSALSFSLGSRGGGRGLGTLGLGWRRDEMSERTTVIS